MDAQGGLRWPVTHAQRRPAMRNVVLDSETVAHVRNFGGRKWWSD